MKPQFFLADNQTHMRQLLVGAVSIPSELTQHVRLAVLDPMLKNGVNGAFTASVHIVLVVFAMTRVSWNKSARAEEKVSFTKSLVSSGAVANLDPRPEEEQAGAEQ